MISICLTLNNNCDSAQSQIVPDNTLGNENSQLRSNVEVRGLTTELIEGGALRDGNLFHSFQEFNVNQNSSVYFANPEGIVNILGRVTGNNISNILGTLGVDGSANLFLLNPNGIVFGENAALDVNGSFVATSASAIEFGEQGFYSATDPESPPLLTVDPSAFLFNQINPGKIQSQSTAPAGVDSNGDPILGLRVPDGNSLLFLGGEIEINGGSSQSGLHAIDGQLELLGVNQQGTVEINAGSTNLDLIFPQELELADILLRNGAFINTSGEEGGTISLYGKNITLSDQSFVFADTLGDQNGSGVLIKAQDLILDNASRITTDVVGSGQAGNLNIETGQLSILNGSVISSSVFEQGNAGNININTNSLFARNGSAIVTNTLGIGDGGLVSIQAKEQVELSGNTAILSDVTPSAQGNTKGVEINTGSLSLTDGAIISSSVFGQGDSGDINIKTTELLSVDSSVILSEVRPDTLGNSGDVNLFTKSLSLTNGSSISTTTFGQGNGGNINIDASETVSVFELSSLNSSVSGVNGAEAGNINITANDVVFDGGFARSRVDTGAVGNGGDIRITTDSLLVTGIPPELIDSNIGQLVTATFGQGNAGSLTIDASGDVVFDGLRSDVFSLIGGNLRNPDIGPAVGNTGGITINSRSLSIKNQARLVSNVEGIGIAGNININTNSLSIMDGGNLLTEVDPIGIGDAGNIEIVTGTLDVINGGRLNARTVGTGDAGNITIKATDSIFLEGIEGNDINNELQSTITTTTFGIESNGNGGDINLQSESISIEQGFIINSVSQSTGNGGNIEIDANRVKVENGLVNASALAGGKAGNISIRNAELVEVSGFELDVLQTNILTPAILDPNSIRELTQNPNSLNTDIVQGILAYTSGEGTAGGIDIETQRLVLSNGALISTASLGSGKAGTTRINASELFQVDGGIVAAPTLATGDAGDIEINTGQLLVQNGGQVVATTLDEGDAGNLSVKASESIELIGAGEQRELINTGLSVGSQSPTVSGNGGDLEITTPKLEIRDGAAVTAIAQGEGNGGNIDIQASEILLLRNNGLISATAGSAGTGGDGGNIDINADFLVTTPLENSDIIANAFEGNGGNINIQAQGVLGIEERQATEDNITNDIDASSEFGLSGVVQFDVPDIELSTETVKLTTQLTETKVAQVCEPGEFQGQNEFFVSGRSGLPDSPTGVLEGDLGWEDWQIGNRRFSSSKLDIINQNLNLTNSMRSPVNNGQAKIIEAQSWIVNDRGKVELIADSSSNSSHDFWEKATKCHSN